MIRVLVVDDQQLIREGIASLLGLQDGIEVIGTAADGKEAVERVLADAPDVVLMDVRMPELDGVAAVAVLRAQAPACRVLMLTTFDDEDLVLRSLRAGATGYLLKDLPTTALADAVRLAHAGITPLDPTAARHVTAALSPSPAANPLTARETDILRLVARGATNREIATRLYLSEGTVKNHISRILTRLNLRDRTQAAIHARDNGIL
ncbi:response regulator [Actinokineospora inagensis]|uniref:response regulator n=1 Tax=Actinokineospora inagensis TaxID=103730 RepID=UPI00042A25BD|nr:response regulator transcription factor [Actinokineospora inagensis]